MSRNLGPGTLVAGAAILCASVSFADSISINFEPPTYNAAANLHLQDGWSAFGAAGSGCALYDHKLDNVYARPVAFGTTSLRMSNATTSGCFGDQTFSKSLIDAAGETSAEGGTMSSPPVGNHFEAEWSFISTTPAAEQASLSVVASPDRGDGARMSWVQMTDTPTGVNVNFYDYQDLAPHGDLVGDPLGCGMEDDFFFTSVATGLDRTVPHKIKITMDLFEGPRNDSVSIYVDGVLKHTGTSWEDYFRYCEGNPTRTVDSVLFRTGGGAAPATLGKGWLIDGLSLRSGFLQVPIDLRPGSPSNQINTGSRALIPIAILSRPGFSPVADVDQDSIDVRGATPLSTKSSMDDLNNDGVDDLTLYFRARDFAPPSSAECHDANAQILLTGFTNSNAASFEGHDRVVWQGCK